VCMAEEECEGGAEHFATHTTSSAYLLLSFFEGVRKHSKVFLYVQFM
jgi:hypothetical protein